MRIRKHLSNKARSKISEKRAAKIFNGRVQPASGALPSSFLKADVKSEKFLVDDKTTVRSSFAINVEVWRKLVKESFINRKRPAMRIEFAEGPTLYVFDESTAMEII